jgi:hypothetical protein
MLSNRSISSVLRDIVQNVQDIVSSEFRLAQSEIGDEVEKARVAVLVLGIGASCGFLAIAFALLSLFFGLTRVVPNWAAALIIAAVMGLGSVVIIFLGRKRFREVHSVPERVVERLKESVQWARQHSS